MSLLSSEKYQQQHLQLVNRIVEKVQPETIYLLATTAVQQKTESIFNLTPPTCRSISHYYLLILVKKGCGESYNSIQDKIENSCQSFIPVTTFIFGFEDFEEWLVQHHYFAWNVYKRSLLLYGNPPSHKGFVPELEKLKPYEKDWLEPNLNKVGEFLAGAELYSIRQQNNMAVFMLHQATEHALHAILRVHTGLYVTSHNLDKLVRYCQMVCYQLPSIFPRNNDKNKRLFHLLQKSYVEARYRDDYKINKDDVAVISDYVKELVRLISNIVTNLP